MTKRTVSGRKLVLLGGSLSLVVLFGITLAFRTFGLGRFVANSQLQEGKSNVIYLARDVAVCAQKTGKLPPTTHTVPMDLSQVGGKAYKSTAADWADEAFSCDGFRVRDAQRFQYQWERTSDHTGIARARADFNGDGVVEATYEQELVCAMKKGAFRCEPGAFHDRAK
jgi:hypothetical protein